MIRFNFLALLAGSLLAQTPPAPTAAPKPAVPAAAPKPAAPARDPGLYATITTSMGTIVAVLYEKEAPATVRNFVALSRGTKAWTDPKTGQKVTRPLYSGTIFHRVIPGFMIQGGDPTGTGMGDGGLTPLPDEIVESLKFDRPGRLGMANHGKNSSTCQFFITEVPYPSLNGGYTIFGQVVEGQDLVPKIAGVPRDANDKPKTPIRLISIKVTREGPPPAAPVTTKKAAPSTTKAVTPTAPSAAKKATTTTPAPTKK